MGAKLVVTTGPGSGTEFRIEKGVVRVGSAAHCECVLTGGDVPEHVLTLQQRGTQYRVFNKSRRQLALDGEAFAAGTSRTWTPGTHLHLSDDVTVCLVLDESQATGRSAVDSLFAEPAVETTPEVSPETAEAEEGEADEEQEGPAKGFSGKDAAYLVVTAVIIAATVLLGMYDPDAKPETPENKVAADIEKHSLVELLKRVKATEAIKDPSHPDHDWMSHLSEELHEAWRSAGSGDTAGACRHYQTVTKLLLTNGEQPEQPGRFKDTQNLYADDALHQDLYNFAVAQCRE